MARTVLIVDDHARFRASARALLQDLGYRVLGEADSGEAALAEVRRLRPDLVLLDVQLPGIDGFAVADRLAAEADPPAVVLTSSRSERTYRRRLATSPACGFVAKADLSAACLDALLA